MLSLLIFSTAPSDTISSVSNATLKFLAGVLSSGIAYGVFAVLLIRILKKDKDAIEKTMEGFRQKLGKSSLPVLEIASSAISWALRTVYGRSAGQRLMASLCIGLTVTSVMFCSLGIFYLGIREKLRPVKVEIERSVNPWLYERGASSNYSEEWRKAFIYESHMNRMIVPRFSGSPYEEIRKGANEFFPGFIAAISESPDSFGLSLLTLFEGTYVSPGFEWGTLLGALLFNVLIDFIAASVAAVIFIELARQPSTGNAIASIAALLLATGVLLLMSVVCYQQMFRGNTGVFFQVLIVLPLCCLAFLGSAGIFFAWLSSLRSEPEFWNFSLSLGVLAMAGTLFVLGVQFARNIWRYWSATLWHLPRLHDWGALSYVLAMTVLIPLLIVVACTLTALVLKGAAEPGRILTWAYMTWVKDHQSGTQVSGVVALLAVLTGIIFSFVT
jgi:hypothetical protein